MDKYEEYSEAAIGKIAQLYGPNFLVGRVWNWKKEGKIPKKYFNQSSLTFDGTPVNVIAYRNNIKISDISFATGISRPTLSKIMDGSTTNPSGKVYLKIRDYFKGLNLI